MNIIKIENKYHAENRPALTAKTGEWWFLYGKLHRGGGLPAIITPYTRQYYHRGIYITEKIARGNMSFTDILKIENIEQRNAAIEIIGYEKCIKYCVEIDRYTPNGYENKFPLKLKPMYKLLILKNDIDEKQNEPIKLLEMHDPNKYMGCLYIIRVHPDAVTCQEAVAKSYGFKTWAKYFDTALWEQSGNEIYP